MLLSLIKTLNLSCVLISKRSLDLKGSFKKVIKNIKTTPTIKTDRNSKN
ncbi:hypothetical protein HPHPH11_0689 [Helicobacter pylori Hp H-11]|nr:hypothetical protein HPHPH11_0689 [Helicobacter pylori Hp H-11]